MTRKSCLNPLCLNSLLSVLSPSIIEIFPVAKSQSPCVYCFFLSSVSKSSHLSDVNVTSLSKSVFGFS